MHFGNTRHCSDHWNSCLPAARNHVQVLRVDVLFEVHHRHAIRADSCWSKVDHSNARLALTQHGVVFDMSAGTGCIEDEIDVSKFWHFDQARDTLVGCGDAHSACAGKAVRSGVDTNHHGHFQVL
ncbi:hypothetical protein D9M73_205710 [compost metagenome]